jgi:hypothetical protein
MYVIPAKAGIQSKAHERIIMQLFFDQVKTLLADNVTDFDKEQSGSVYIELNYRNNKIEIDYNPGSLGGKYAPGSTSATFVLSIDLKSDFELEVLPKSFIDRLFDIQADVSPFDPTNKFKIKLPSLDHELLIHTNNEDRAKKLLFLPDVNKIIDEYGITFFKIEDGELKVYLDQLSSEKFEELKSNPVLINKYLDILADLSGHIK